MFNRLKGRFSILFARLFGSYIMFLLVPIIVFVLIFNNSIMDNFEKQLSDANMSKISIVRNNVDTVLDHLIKEALKISISSDIGEMYGVSGKDIKGDFNSVSKIRNVYELLSDIKKVNEDIDSIYFYNGSTQSIVTSSGTYHDLEQFHDTSWIDYYMNDEERIMILNTRVPVDEHFLKNLSKLESRGINYKQSIITLVYPLSLYTSKVEGAIAINMDAEKFKRYLNATDINDGHTFVVDVNGDRIISSDNKKIAGNVSEESYFGRIIESEKNSGYFRTSFDDKEHLITYTKSVTNNWIYIELTPIQSLFQQLDDFKKIMIVISVVFILLGIAISYFLSIRLYNPVKNMINRLVDQVGIETDLKKGELVALSNAVNQLIKEDKQTHEQIKKSRSSVREAYLLSLLRGDSQGTMQQEIFDYNQFVCMVVSIDRYSDFEKNYSYEEQYYFKLIISKMIDEVVANYASGGVVIMECDKIAIIISHEEQTLNSGEGLTSRIGSRIIKELKNIQDISVTLSVGNSYSGKENIRQSFMEATASLKYKILYGYGSIIHNNQIRERSSDYYYPVAEERHIINYLKLNSSDELISVIESLIADIESRTDIDYNTMTQIFNQLINNSLKYLVTEHIKISEVFPEDISIMRELNNKETLDEIKEWLIYFYTTIIKHQKDHLNSNKRHMLKIIDYIHNNYSDSDMDINSIVDETGLSYSHLRKIFKENIGENLIDYLNNIRINESKKLLNTTNLTIVEIAEKTGYNSDRSFTRHFKKNEGVTPGKFRRISKEEKTI